MTGLGTGRRRRWWRIGLPALVVLLFTPEAGSEAIVPREGKGVGSARGLRSRGPGIGHTVRAGDTLWNISRRYGVDLADLTRVNRLRTEQPIRVGQRLAIPSAHVDDGRQEPPSLAEIVLAPPPEARRVALAWPVTAPVGSGFGPRGASWHGGIDLTADRGTPIRAAAPGMVIASGWERGYGNVVKVWHAQDLMTVYAHNHENHVRPGDWVERGQVVGTVGGTGRATAPHLHFEVRLDGRKYDPLFWLPEPWVTDVARLGVAGSP